MLSEDVIFKYKNKVINLLILFILVIVALRIYNAQSKKVEFLKENKKIVLKKNGVLKNLQEVERKFNAYEKFINNKEISSLINTIGSIAKESAVEITSIRPLAKEDTPVFIKYPFDLKAQSNNYHNIGKFISNLENHPDIFLVESAIITPVSRSQEQGADKLNLDLRISTVLLKNLNIENDKP